MITSRILNPESSFMGNEIIELEDQPNMQSSELKGKFDAGLKNVMVPAFNGLISDLGSTAAGASGAANIGVETIEGLTGNDVQAVLQAIKDKIVVGLPGEIKQFGGMTAPAGTLFCTGSAVSRTTYANLFAALTKSTSGITITNATPAVATLNAHGLATGDSFYLRTTDALPTGLSINTQYYVIYRDANSFYIASSLANALAGTKIATSGAGSGTHTITECPWGIGDGTTTFNLPNLNGRVLVGRDASQAEFGGLGQAGGAKTQTIAQANLPDITMLVGKTNVPTDNFSVDGAGSGTFQLSVTSSTAGNPAAKLAVKSGGSGTGLPILPPYEVVNYIIVY